ncbi:MAG: exonuclease domain-containing protein [Acidobacteria bacterium]|nr:exonuclease domain-containing protein [Acidobacteriota bacterium]
MQFNAWRDLVRRNPRVDGLTFIAFDTETTGMWSPDRLVEIAGVKFRGGKILDEISLLIDPCMPIPPETTLIHGITDAMVRGEWKAPGALREFFEFSRNAIWIAHNAPFDAGVIAGETFRAGCLPPEGPILDTLRMSRKTLPASRHSLETLVRELDLPPENHHRALPDSRHVFRLFGRICQKVDEGGNPTLSGIMEINGEEITLGKYLPECPDLPEEFEPLREASLSETPVSILYAPSGGNAGYRTVTPRLFYRRKEVIYMEATCHASGSRKCYRLDRIRKFHSAAEEG